MQGKGEVRAPERPIEVGDVVRVWREQPLWEVVGIEGEGDQDYWTEVSLRPAAGGNSRLRVSTINLIDRVPPVIEIETLPSGGPVQIDRYAEVPIAVAGEGWFEAFGEIRQVVWIRGFEMPLLYPWPARQDIVTPVAVLKVGDSIVVDGVTFRVRASVGRHGVGSLEPMLERVPVALTTD